MCFRQFRIQLAFGTFYNIAMTLGIFQSVKKGKKMCKYKKRKCQQGPFQYWVVIFIRVNKKNSAFDLFGSFHLTSSDYNSFPNISAIMHIVNKIHKS